MHPEFGSLFCRRREIDLLLLLTDPDLVGFCPDTAHITLAGGDPIAITEQHRDRVLLTHWKDAAGRFEGELPDGDKRFEAIAPRFLPIGEGTVDWDGWRRMLERIDYRGWIVLELDDSPDPVEQISRARRFVEEALV
jgi:inosose dehydratase